MYQAVWHAALLYAADLLPAMPPTPTVCCSRCLSTKDLIKIDPLRAANGRETRPNRIVSDAFKLLYTDVQHRGGNTSLFDERLWQRPALPLMLPPSSSSSGPGRWQNEKNTTRDTRKGAR